MSEVLDLHAYSMVCLFLAAKFNEIHWPALKDLIYGRSMEILLQIESDILVCFDFKLPFPHYWPIVTLFEHIFFDGRFHLETMFKTIKKGILLGSIFKYPPI